MGHLPLRTRLGDLGELMRLVLVAAGRQDGRMRWGPADPVTVERVRSAVHRYWVNEWVRQLEQGIGWESLDRPKGD